MNRRTVVQLLDFVSTSRRSLEFFLVLLAEELRTRGWQTVHVFAGEPCAGFREDLRRVGSPYLLADFPLSVRNAIRLGRQLRPYGPDVLQTHFLSLFSPSLPVLKRVARARHLVFTDRTSGFTSRKGPLGRVLARLRAAIACRYIDRTIAVSDFVRRRETDSLFIPAEKVRLIHNGVDLAAYAPRQRADNPLFTIGYLGRLIPEKGVRTLLQAVKVLRSGGAPAVRVLIAGEGPQERELKQLCSELALDAVDFFGQIDWVPRFLNSVDVVVVPSQWEEAFGRAALEAMAVGACVVGSDAGGIPEVLGPSGEAGAVFRRGDAGDLARVLRCLMNDPARRNSMRIAARRRAAEHFSVERVVRDYAAVIEELYEGNA